MRFIIFLFFVVFLQAEQINKYDVNVHILENGDIDVVEKILYDFSPNKRHGVFRNIPINKNIIDLISVNQDNKPANYDTYLENGDLVIKIGDKDTLITSEHLYTIHYVIKRAVFKKNDNFNAISLNAIGTGWKVNINDINIDVYLPSKLSTAKFVVYVGEKGSVKKLNYQKINSTHYKIYISHLAPHEGITFDVIFDKKLINIYKPNILWIYLYLFIAILGIYFYYSKYKMPYISKSPKYYPPKDLSVLKAGLLIDEVADLKDISTAVLELATKGYLKIEYKSNGIFFKKLKNGEDLNDEQAILFEQLVGDIEIGDIRYSKNVSIDGNQINNWLYDWGLKEGYFFETLSNLQFSFLFKIGLFLLPFIGYAFYQNFGFNFSLIFDKAIILVFIIIGVEIFFSRSLISKIVGIIFVSFAIYMFYLESAIEYEYTILLSIIPFVFAMYLSNKLSVYTPKGIKKLKYLLGLQEFILRVEKDKIERFLKEDPNYLDKMLPYAVLFGVEHWLELYIEFDVDKSWYVGDSVMFSVLAETLYDNLSKSNINEDSDSFSSGGSSGSGSGGGGGGSW